MAVKCNIFLLFAWAMYSPKRHPCASGNARQGAPVVAHSHIAGISFLITLSHSQDAKEDSELRSVHPSVRGHHSCHVRHPYSPPQLHASPTHTTLPHHNNCTRSMECLPCTGSAHSDIHRTFPCSVQTSSSSTQSHQV